VEFELHAIQEGLIGFKLRWILLWLWFEPWWILVEFWWVESTWVIKEEYNERRDSLVLHRLKGKMAKCSNMIRS